MKKSKKILITVAVILVAVGMICGFCGIYSLGFNFNEISTSDFVTHTYTVEDDFTNIIIEDAASNINFYKSNDDKCRVLCDEREKVTHTVVNENNTLTVRVKDERNWFERINIGFFAADMRVSVYLPKNKYDSLNAASMSGDIDVANEFTFDNAKVGSISGDVSVKADVKQELNISSTSGDVYAENLNLEKFNAESTSGDVIINNISATECINASSVSGEIDLSNVKGKEIFAKTTSGGVMLTDTVASQKLKANSTSGEIDLKRCDAKNIVLDTVMVSTSGCKLLRDDAIDALTSVLFPIADIITPNLHEAQILCGFDIRSESDMVRAADVIYNKYNVTVLLKGGHLANTSNDLLYDGNETWFEAVRIDNPNTHGTGCTLSSAIAANLAKGMDIKTAVKSAKDYITGALSDMLDLGKGSGPLNHMYKFYPNKK